MAKQLNIDFLLNGREPQQLQPKEQKLVEYEFQAAFLNKRKLTKCRNIFQPVFEQHWMIYLFKKRHELAHCTYEFLENMEAHVAEHYQTIFTHQVEQVRRDCLDWLDRWLPQR